MHPAGPSSTAASAGRHMGPLSSLTANTACLVMGSGPLGPSWHVGSWVRPGSGLGAAWPKLRLPPTCLLMWVNCRHGAGCWASDLREQAGPLAGGGVSQHRARDVLSRGPAGRPAPHVWLKLSSCLGVGWCGRVPLPSSVCVTLCLCLNER